MDHTEETVKQERHARMVRTGICDCGSAIQCRPVDKEETEYLYYCEECGARAVISAEARRVLAVGDDDPALRELEQAAGLFRFCMKEQLAANREKGTEWRDMPVRDLLEELERASVLLDDEAAQHLAADGQFQVMLKDEAEEVIKRAANVANYASFVAMRARRFTG